MFVWDRLCARSDAITREIIGTGRRCHLDTTANNPDGRHGD
jgi:hypothetical protein